jgi:hypothetical protein
VFLGQVCTRKLTDMLPIEYQPTFKGAIMPDESVEATLDVIEKASVANGDGGGYYSHIGKGEKWI